MKTRDYSNLGQEVLDFSFFRIKKTWLRHYWHVFTFKLVETAWTTSDIWIGISPFFKSLKKVRYMTIQFIKVDKIGTFSVLPDTVLAMWNLNETEWIQLQSMLVISKLIVGVCVLSQDKHGFAVVGHVEGIIQLTGHHSVWTMKFSQICSFIHLEWVATPLFCSGSRAAKLESFSVMWPIFTPWRKMSQRMHWRSK